MKRAKKINFGIKKLSAYKKQIPFDTITRRLRKEIRPVSFKIRKILAHSQRPCFEHAGLLGVGILILLIFNFFCPLLARAEVTPVSAETCFSQNSEPEFVLKTRGLIKSRETKKGERELNLGSSRIEVGVSREGEPVSVVPEIETIPERGDQFKIKIQSTPQFYPGKYTLEVDLDTPLKDQTIEQDFSWGVLAINPDQSIYRPNQEAFIGMAVLDDEGKMVDDAKVVLEIINPAGENTILSTENGTIKISPQIHYKGPTELPDYYTSYQTGGAGEYQMRLRAETKNGVRELGDHFYVEEKPKFEVKRDGHTRIYPLVPYKMRLEIKANQDSPGPVREYVPSSFEITESPEFKTHTSGQFKVLTWDQGFKAGEKRTLEYQYDAPDISPQFYLSGPLRIGTDFEEKRSWQIAVDDTLTLRPDGEGSSTEWDLGAGASNWEAVSEASQDGDTSYVYQDAESPEDDLYEIGTNALLEGATINSVTVYGYAKSVKSGSGVCSTADLYFLVESGGTSDVGSSNNLTTSYAPYSEVWYNNPDTLQPWEKAEIDDLEVGIRSEKEDGTGSSKHTPRVTQVYVEVDYDPPSIVTISGSTDLASGTVALAINADPQGDTGEIADSSWEITDITLDSGDIVTVWLDGGEGSGEGTTGVAKYDGSGDMTGMVLNEHVLSIGSVDNQSLILTNLGLYDNDDNSDIMHSANSSVLNVDAGDNYSDEKIDILSGDTLTISGTETLNTHDLANNGTLTSGGNSAYNVSGGWDNNSTFTPSSSTVTFTATAGAETIDSSGGTGAFNTLNLGQTSGTATWNLSSILDVNGVLTIDYGTLGQGTNNITLANSLAINANGNFTSGSGTFTFDGSTGPYTWANSGTQDDLGVVNINGSGLTINLNSSVTATSVNVALSQTLGLGSSTFTLTLTGSGTAGSRPFIVAGTLTEGSDSTVNYAGTSATEIEAETYYNLDLIPASGVNPTYTLGTAVSQTIGTNNLQMGSGDGTTPVTVTAATYNPALNVDGNLSISDSSAFTASGSASFTVGGNWSNVGSFTHSSGSIIFDASTAGKTIESGGDNFNNIQFNSSSGGWTIQTDSLTCAGNFAVTNTASLAVSSITLTVQGTYSIADDEPSNTSWTGSTLVLSNATPYIIGSRTQNAEVYNIITINTNTDIKLWQSSASTYNVDSSGSLYSQDHANNDGDLYIWGDYHVQTNDYWSYGTDFEGTAGANRQVDVRIKDGGAVNVESGDTLAAIGESSNRTTVSRQDSTTGYDLIVNQGTINFQYTDFDYLNGADGINIQASSTVTSLANCAFDNLVGTVATDDAFITVASSVIGSAETDFTGCQFDNTGPGAEFNVNRTGSDDTGWWNFDSATGAFEGEDYDGKEGVNEADPGMLRWDDSAWNAAPNDPSDLAQKKTDETVLNVGDWTDQTSVKFTATASDPDNPDTLYLEVEAKNVSTAFDGTGTSTGSGVAYEGSPVTVTVTISTLSDDTEYHWRARVVDEASEPSNWVAYGANGDTPPADRDFGTDTSDPTGGTVYDGASGDQDWNDGSLTTLEANWTGFDCSVSGLDYYEYAMRREPDDYYWNEGTTTWQSGEAWYDNGTDTSVQVNSMNLQTGVIYYASVRATDNATNTGTPVDSNGQQVSPTLSFALSGNTVTFDDLNDLNSWTDTKTLTTTTSTNASNGYTASAYITQLLTSLAYPSETVANFYGTWSNPEPWPGGTYGFGYTSNDTLVQGSNRFNGGTEYAGFSQTASGDIVCDHTDAVNGSTGAVTDEQFIVTYKVAVSTSQVSSTYRTYAIYVATANY